MNLRRGKRERDRERKREKEREREGGRQRQGDKDRKRACHEKLGDRESKPNLSICDSISTATPCV